MRVQDAGAYFHDALCWAMSAKTLLSIIHHL
jgi:hypothetical protein